MMRATIDTNVFVYMLDASEPLKQAAAVELVSSLRSAACAVSLQTVGELYAALTGRLRRAPWEAGQASRNLLAAFPSFGASRAAVERALAEATSGRYSYWDALQLASAHEAGCHYCFSEDMSEGEKFGDVEIIHPFGPQGLNERTRSLMESLRR
jgi:predicted nucleic acid-binding protein